MRTPDDDGVGNSYGKTASSVKSWIVCSMTRNGKSSRSKRFWSAQKLPNNFTFEIDLFNADTQEEFAEAVKDLTDNKKIMCVAGNRCGGSLREIALGKRSH